MLSSIVLVSLLPFTILSASTPDLSVYPACARPCLSDQIQKSKCYNSDASLQQQIACLCTDTGYLSATTKCVTGACSPSDGQTTYMVGQELCQQAGVSAQQYSSAAIGGAGATATPSASGGSSSAAPSGSGSASTTAAASSGSGSASASGSGGGAGTTPAGTETSSSGSSSGTAASETGNAATVLTGGKEILAMGMAAALLLILGVDTNGDKAEVLDFETYPTAKKLVERCREFFAEVQNLTPGHELEHRLNTEYGPSNPFYEDFCRYVRQGLEEGWVAQTELDGKKYRRGKIAIPSAESRFFSITTVYMSSQQEYSGQYHAHPYGEINCVVQLDKTAELKGMQGWQGAGWTSPGPGTHHYPQVRNGALVALFFLPAGRIAYNATPEMPQPKCLQTATYHHAKDLSAEGCTQSHAMYRKTGSSDGDQCRGYRLLTLRKNR